jgi:hypothetical protein
MSIGTFIYQVGAKQAYLVMRIANINLPVKYNNKNMKCKHGFNKYGGKLRPSLIISKYEGCP